MSLAPFISDHSFLSPAEKNIFALDKLVIPIHIDSNHYFTVCVYMQDRIIKVFDSLPESTDRSICKGHILSYLKEEHVHRHKVPLPDAHLWKIVDETPTFKTPRQSSTPNDCGVYTCLYMDFLLLNLPLADLTQECIQDFGREWLCKCILNKCITF